MSNQHVAVVGGGIIGLSSALGALESGASVRIFDPKIGGGATSAAAGMLSPGGEFLGGFQPDYASARQAFEDWDGFAQILGVNIHRCETSVVGWTYGDRADIARYLSSATDHGVMTRDPIPDGFDLSPRLSVAATLSDEGFVDADEVVAALRERLRELGATVSEETVTHIAPGETGGLVHTASGTQRFDQIVIATGALIPPLSSVPQISLQAVRGVTLRVRMAAGRPAMLRGLIDGRSVYLVRRPNGVTVIGASSDLQSHPVVQNRDVLELLEMATKIVPDVHDALFIDARAGLRPSSVDGLPFFHSVSPDVVWTTGYFRHGILMAPIAAARAKEFVGARSHI